MMDDPPHLIHTMMDDFHLCYFRVFSVVVSDPHAADRAREQRARQAKARADAAETAACCACCLALCACLN